MAADEQVLDLESAESRDRGEIWRRSRDAQIAADAWLWPRKRDRVEEAEGEKNLRGGAGFVLFKIWGES